MSITHAEKVAAEEKEAAEAEGLEPLPDYLQDLRQEYLELNKKESEIKRDKEAVKSLIAEELKKRGAKMFTLNGANILGYNDTTKYPLNKERLEQDFGKDIIAQYIDVQKGQQFYCAK